MLCFVSSVYASSDLEKKMIEAEAQGSWKKAYSVAQEIIEKLNSKPNDALLKKEMEDHAASLRALEYAPLYHNQGLTKQAIKLLEDRLTAMEKSSSFFNSYLIIEISKLLSQYKNAYQPEILKKVELEYEKVLLNKNSRNYTDAVKGITELLKNYEESLSQDQKLKYEQQLLELQNHQLAESHPDFITKMIKPAKDSFVDIIIAVIYLLTGFLLVLSIGRLWSKRPWISEAMEICLIDNSIESNSNTTQNNLLSRKLEEMVLNVDKSDVSNMEYLVELTKSAMLIAPEKSNVFDAYATQINTTALLTVGPFSLSPQQLFNFLAQLFRSRYRFILSGNLTKEDTQYVLSVRLKDEKDRKKEDVWITGRADNRDAAIEQVALQLFVKRAKIKTTENWRSLDSMIKAQRYIREAADFEKIQVRRDLYDKARKLLQASIVIDPANWMARYRLANVLPGLGEHDLARWQFSYLADLLCSDEMLDRKGIKEYIRHVTTFPFLLLYNVAVCEAKQGVIENVYLGHGGTKSALKILRLIVETLKEVVYDEKVKVHFDTLLDQPPLFPSDGDKNVKYVIQQCKSIKIKIYQDKKITINADEAIELLMQIMATELASLCDLLEYKKYHIANDHSIDKIYQSIITKEKWFFEQQFELQKINPSTYAYCHALSQNACGRAHYLQRNFLEAQNFLIWATSYHLPAGFPEPYINLGSLYLKAQEEISADWMELAKRYLDKALEISPDNKKANYQMGKLYYLRRYEAQEEGKDKFVDRAIYYFSSSGIDPWSLFHLGLIYEEQGKFELAISKLRRAININANIRQAIKLYIVTVVRYLNQQQKFTTNENNLAEHARKMITKYFVKSEKDSETKFAAEKLSQIDELKQKLASINTDSVKE